MKITECGKRECDHESEQNDLLYEQALASLGLVQLTLSLFRL